MRYLTLFCVLSGLVPSYGFGKETEAITLATHNQTLSPPPVVDKQATERIKKIVLNQGDDARALANLVQLTRKLPAATTSQLYFDLANEYLQHGKYNQAGNLLQQLLNQHPEQPVAGDALTKLVRLYSSSEVAFIESFNHSESRNQEVKQGLRKYAIYTADRTLQRNAALGNHPALTFQRAVATRLGGRSKAAQGRLSRLKHNSQAGIWRTYALAEPWLQGKREDEPPMPVVVCRQADERPHLDGVLDDSLWQADESVQFSYDEGFLYLAISFPKIDGETYAADVRPRTYDADLTRHDHLQLRLDCDRDYATCFELAVDHRGQTNDRCWLDASWNPQWFVAAGGDDSHWTVEAAIPWGSLTAAPPQTGDAWAVAWDRVLPKSASHSPGEGASATGDRFSLLLFE